MDKKTAEEIERAIYARLDRLLTAGGSSTLMTVSFMIEAAKTEVAIALAPYKV
jgi:hypothetical protein